MTRDLVKAFLINAAYQGASAVCEPLISEPGALATGPTGAIPIDPLIQDAGLQSKGVMVYEEAKIQYAAIVRAFEDKTGVWPDPKVTEDSAGAPPAKADPTQMVGTIASLLTKAVPGNKAISTIADVIAALNAVAGVASAVKAPGQELPAQPAQPATATTK